MIEIEIEIEIERALGEGMEAKARERLRHFPTLVLWSVPSSPSRRSITSALARSLARERPLIDAASRLSSNRSLSDHTSRYEL